MKLITKYWPVVYAILIAIYEAYSFVSDNEFLPIWFKSIAGILAFIGLVAKNYKSEKNTSSKPNDQVPPEI